MLVNYSTTKGPGSVAEVADGDSSWTNRNNALVDDNNYASATTGPGDGGGPANRLAFTNFGFELPPFAVIDGITVSVDAQASGGPVGYATCELIATGAGDPATAVPPWNSSRSVVTNGGTTDLWSKTDWTPADINSSSFGARLNYFYGSGVWEQQLYYMSITVNWHIDIDVAPEDVPVRVDYKTYTRDGEYLGLLPHVTSKLSFAQDKNSAGATTEIICGADIRNFVEIDNLLTEAGDDILTEDNQPILTTLNNMKVIQGNDDSVALFKNSNRVEAWLYDYWNPNGKLMFKGQINRVGFQYGGQGQAVKLIVYSDGYELDNYIARGYPFSYTTEVSQTSQNGYVTSFTNGGKGGGWTTYGQTFITDSDQVNIGAISLYLQGTADVTLSIYDVPNGNLLGSVTKVVSAASASAVQFEFAQLIEVLPSTSYFFNLFVNAGQSIQVYYHSTSSTYANGSRYESIYGGGSGGGAFGAVNGDLYFIIKSGTPTTTATYSSQDPVADMMSAILTDYNNRGGLITEGDFVDTGQSLTYTFQVNTVYDALKKVLDMSPSNYYAYVDLGTAELDIKTVSETADYTVVKGNDVEMLEIGLSIENVKNYLLFTGGDTGGGTNLYRDYQDSVSASYYGLRTSAKTDNRVTLSATADAIGSTFIDENANETQETKITILSDKIDITLLTPGKTIGFRNFDNFIDSLVLEIVRREYTPLGVTLTLGRLPRTLSAEVQALYRGLLNEQTLDNPTSPS